MASEKHTAKSPNLMPATINAWKPRAHRYDEHDTADPALRIRVFPSGVKTFRWSVLDPATGKQRTITLGRFTFLQADGMLTLSQARAELGDLKVAHAAGTLAAAEAALRDKLKPPPPPDPADASPLLSVVADDFMKRRIEPHRKRPEDARRSLKRDILPRLGTRQVASITTTDCVRVITAKVDGGAPGGAAKVLGLLKQLLSFAEGRGHIVRNPAAHLDPDDLGITRGRRKRWLAAEEIPTFWEALNGKPRVAQVTRTDYRTKKERTFTQETPALAATTCAALKVLLLTGVRTGEMLRARWEDVDVKALTWTIPVANQKLTKKQALDARPFVIPITPTTKGLLDVLRREAGKSPWVVTSPMVDDTPTPDPAPYDEKSLGHAMRRMFGGKNPPVKLPGAAVSPHDLRRTMRTHLAKLRVAPHITERCLNHSLGRIVQTYDLHDYLDERREALERWDGYLHQLVTGEGAQVVAFPGGRP